MPADYHIHTNFSGDSKALPEDMVKRAISLGLDEIAITDHLDFPDGTLRPYPHIDIAAYTRRVLELRNTFAAQITIRLGLELGMPASLAGDVWPMLSPYPFDFIICSTHDIGGADLYYGTFFAGKTKQEAYDAYFADVLAHTQACPFFCVYGHLDYQERYVSYSDKAVRYSEHADIIDEILRSLIQSGKGLEVNTSGFRYNLGHTNPQPDILRRYKELGGEIITIGSDAHRPSDVAASFEAARDMLLDLGFKYTARYESLKPFFVKL